MIYTHSLLIIQHFCCKPRKPPYMDPILRSNRKSFKTKILNTVTIRVRLSNLS